MSSAFPVFVRVYPELPDLHKALMGDKRATELRVLFVARHGSPKSVRHWLDWPPMSVLAFELIFPPYMTWLRANGVDAAPSMHTMTIPGPIDDAKNWSGKVYFDIAFQTDKDAALFRMFHDNTEVVHDDAA